MLKNPIVRNVVIWGIDFSATLAATVTAVFLKFGENVLENPSLIGWVLPYLIITPILLSFAFLFSGLYRHSITFHDHRVLYKISFLTLLTISPWYIISKALFGHWPPITLTVLIGAITIVFVYGIRLFASSVLESARDIKKNAGVEDNIAVLGLTPLTRQLLRKITADKKSKVVSIYDIEGRWVGRSICGVMVKDYRKFLSECQDGVDRVFICDYIPRGDLLSIRASGVYVSDVDDTRHYVLDYIPSIMGEVHFNQLLQREVLRKENPFQDALGGKNILVTGAGGTIGGSLIRELMANPNINRIIAVDISEYAIFLLRDAMEAYENMEPPQRFEHITYIVCDILDSKIVDKIMVDFEVDLVFHAAAIKHVRIAEENPRRAWAVNVTGTSILLDMCDRYSSDFVFVSTDKAVNPTTTMGATKRIGEFLVNESARRNTARARVIVRFGNVIGSSGSVIEIFSRQIRSGGPITIRGEGVTRYFMTKEEAAFLVVTAASGCLSGKLAGSADIFILDMGDPIKIEDIANRLLRMFGFDSSPKRSINIISVPLLEGEKTHEELSYIQTECSLYTNKIYKYSEKFPEIPDLRMIVDTLEGCQDDSLFKAEIVRIGQKVAAN